MWAIYPTVSAPDCRESMVWCVDHETAAKIAAFESEWTATPHSAYLANPPDGLLLTHVDSEVFVKWGDHPGTAKAKQRVKMALEAIRAMQGA